MSAPLMFFDHDPDAVLAADVADLMRVHENARRAAGDDRLRIFAHGDHGRFHVDVPVQKARGNHLAGGVDDAGVLADAVGVVGVDDAVPVAVLRGVADAVAVGVARAGRVALVGIGGRAVLVAGVGTGLDVIGGGLHVADVLAPHRRLGVACDVGAEFTGTHGGGDELASGPLRRAEGEGRHLLG